LTTSAQSFSLKETVRVGTCPFGVAGGVSKTREVRGEELTGSSARCSCFAGK